MITDLPFGLKLARKAWKKNPHRKRVTACYIQGGTMIVDSNSKKTSPAAQAYGHRWNRCHAEFNVLKRIEDGSKGVLYIYRETADGKFGLSRPCEFCLRLLKDKGIKKIVYTTKDGYAKEKLIYESL